MAASPPAESTPGREAAGLPAYRRSFQYFALLRLVVAALLIAYMPVMRGSGILDERFDAELFVPVAGLYLVLAAAFFLLSTRSGRLPLPTLATIQIAVDVCALVLLMHASGGQRTGLGVLLLLPSAGAAILVSARVGLTFAAASTLLLLAETGWRGLMGQAGDSAFVQAGLTGATLLVASAVVGRLARRLASQERLAWRRGEDLRNQLAVTQAVIADLPDGVVVLGARGEPRAINRSARDMLAGGGGAAAGLPGLLPLRAALGIGPAGTDAEPPTDSAEFIVPGAEGAERRLRARRLGVPSDGVDEVVVLEDLGRLEARAQQLKLASMGRLSASIAHEIRNPLSAIRHANGLLAEQLGEPRLERLAKIVEDNCRRIDRIIEDVLSISRRGSATPEALPAGAFLVQAIAELVAQSGADARRIECRVHGDMPIWFDAGNLRQVLLNLLGNALRHAGDEPGAVRIDWAPDAGGRWSLVVSDDGPGVAAASRVHLFEPFFTTETRGTGLGLHLARELCTANGATIRYRPASDNPPLRSAFVVEPAPAPGAPR
ncbi:MAG: HAMP domain-containing sensor histidine kinase [Burkholderiales bacterium]|nr:HAMP domain-containing sensor histidine kinase [Burkholderiales bacterium]